MPRFCVTHRYRPVRRARNHRRYTVSYSPSSTLQSHDTRHSAGLHGLVQRYAGAGAQPSSGRWRVSDVGLQMACSSLSACRESADGALHTASNALASEAVPVQDTIATTILHGLLQKSAVPTGYADGNAVCQSYADWRALIHTVCHICHRALLYFLVMCNCVFYFSKPCPVEITFCCVPTSCHTGMFVPRIDTCEMTTQILHVKKPQNWHSPCFRNSKRCRISIVERFQRASCWQS
jgi:hypothetical protein